jgi:hypothetical protein
MAVARIAAIALALYCSTLRSQQAEPVHFLIKVTDSTGAVIPGARIEIDHSPGGAEVAATADREGKAVLNLLPGPHDLMITSRLFERWAKHIVVGDAPGQDILAVMEVDCVHIIRDIWVTADNQAVPLVKQHARTILTVVVTDESCNHVSGANIVVLAIDQITGRAEAVADGGGHALVHLDQGRYRLRVKAIGFQDWEEQNVEVKENMHRYVILARDCTLGPSVCVDDPRLPIPLPRQPVTADFPLIPTQRFLPPAKPFRPEHPPTRPSHT